MEPTASWGISAKCVMRGLNEPHVPASNGPTRIFEAEPAGPMIAPGALATTSVGSAEGDRGEDGCCRAQTRRSPQTCCGAQARRALTGFVDWTFAARSRRTTVRPGGTCYGAATYLMPRHGRLLRFSGAAPLACCATNQNNGGNFKTEATYKATHGASGIPADAAPVSSTRMIGFGEFLKNRASPVSRINWEFGAELAAAQHPIPRHTPPTPT